MAFVSFNKNLSETSLSYNFPEIYIHNYLQCSSFILSWSDYLKGCKCPGLHDLHENIKIFLDFQYFGTKINKIV